MASSCVQWGCEAAQEHRASTHRSSQSQVRGWMGVASVGKRLLVSIPCVDMALSTRVGRGSVCVPRNPPFWEALSAHSQLPAVMVRTPSARVWEKVFIRIMSMRTFFHTHDNGGHLNRHPCNGKAVSRFVFSHTPGNSRC